MSEIEKLLSDCCEVEKMLDEPDELTSLIVANSISDNEGELQDEELNQVTGGCALAKVHVKERILKQLHLN